MHGLQILLCSHIHADCKKNWPAQVATRATNKVSGQLTQASRNRFRHDGELSAAWWLLSTRPKPLANILVLITVAQSTIRPSPTTASHPFKAQFLRIIVVLNRDSSRTPDGLTKGNGTLVG